jgi:hypothetical protein
MEIHLKSKLTGQLSKRKILSKTSSNSRKGTFKRYKKN